MNNQSNTAPVLTLPSHITSLKTAGTLIAVEMSVWTGTKGDESIARKVSEDNRATQKIGKWTHDLLSGDADLKAVLNHRQTVYNWLKARTFDWAGSLRWLPSPRIETVLGIEYKQLEAEFDAKVKKFLDAYDDKVAAQAFVRVDAFKRSDYPTREELASKFSMRLIVMDVPETDLRVQVANDLARDLQATMQRQMNDAIRSIHQQQVAQLVEVMKSISHCCEVEESVGKDGEIKIKRRKIYDSTIAKALEYCDTFESTNVAGDPLLEEARSALYNALRRADAATLRESDTMREKVKADVDSILSKFGGG